MLFVVLHYTNCRQYSLNLKSRLNICSVHWTGFELSMSKAPDFTWVLPPWPVIYLHGHSELVPGTITDNKLYQYWFQRNWFSPTLGKATGSKDITIKSSVKPRKPLSFYLMFVIHICHLVYFIWNKIGLFSHEQTLDVTFSFLLVLTEQAWFFHSLPHPALFQILLLTTN